MEPTTLRLSTELKEELDAEADAAGFSSRSEYIRYLIANRETSSTATPNETGQATSDTGRDEEVLEALSDLRAKVASIEDRVTDLESDVATLQGDEEHDESLQDTDEEHTSGEMSPGEEKGVSDDEAIQQLQDWLADNGPDSDAARAILLDAARLLDEDGPLQAGDLREALYERHPEAYGSATVLWSATISRWYEDIPGFENPEYGLYRFSQDRFLDHLSD